ncbi:hypothetical protein TREMEDRAFT_62429 [Tremella mesenterica DSM 1558]|uniref:uncharacterized protein n=1 Tax=Tremella mesenterica (strain ATCC 24925 / CBS 8224 / DSM 1558 / NBRC 9311 / NRRL Y-6157 / RJB 2259-6 / UBC 559-6) TaxID=578456 RepID=UPI0003F49B18|nr:uncharacterized protein TREMEDRAFT_62429 [Tremella mesenterica DSM 1558]EIW69569.1 hypothetical protein TREMEDRAFT_62429 [Tremella mesenterica DSM 1558]
MNRRGHLSTKIPLVKLRPVPARNAKGKARDSSPIDDSALQEYLWKDAEDSELTNVALQNGSKPWKNVVITFTGVEDKVRLSGLARELGARVESALTIHVTHIVAVGFTSEKYQYALEHRMPIMTPQWIEHGHERWLAGEEFLPSEDLSEWKLKPFAGLRISITGIEPVERRKEIVAYVNSNGGVYSKDLDRHCTHLISDKMTSEMKSSDKVKWALKEIKSREASRRAGKKSKGEDMKIVYEDWLWDCIAYEGRWKEEKYDARKPRRTGKVKAEDVLNGTVFKDPAPATVVKEEEPDEPAALRKQKRDDGLDILVGQLLETKEVVKWSKTPLDDLHEVTQDPLPLDPPMRSDSTRADPSRIPSSKKPEKRPSMLHASRTTSFAPGSSKSPLSAIPLTSLNPTASFAATQPPIPAQAADSKEQDGIPQIFSGLTFSHTIMEHYEGLEKALTAHGGTLASQKDDNVDFVIVRLANTNKPDLPTNSQAQVVTECWVEGCCFEQKLLSPSDHLVFRPLSATMPVNGTSNMLIHLSGHSSENTVYLRRIIRAIGATLSVKLNRQTTHLVCATPSGQKYEKALEWGVSVVQSTWLLTMAETGILVKDTDHRHSSVTKVDSNTNTNPQSSTGQLALDQVLRVGDEHGTSQSSTLDPSRKLGLTPTHIGDGLGSNPGSASGSGPLREKGNGKTVLSQSNPETERKLNQADQTNEGILFERSASGKEISLEVKLAKTTPVNVVTTPVTKVNEALKQLAEIGQPSGHKSKAIRRSRPSSRLKPSHTPLTTSVSPHSRSPTSPDISFDITDPIIDLKTTTRDPEESVRWEDADPKVVDKYKRMREAFGGSPRKKSKIIKDALISYALFPSPSVQP